MSNYSNILETFSTISLNEIEQVKLMDRTDRKFTFNTDELKVLLPKLNPYYKVLKVEKHLINSYNTLYFDTPDLALYLKHHNGKLNRYKVRHRTYVESKLGFLEVKHKTNKGRTIKERIKLNVYNAPWNEKSKVFLNEKSPISPNLLKPVLWVNYQRITLVGKNSPERVTIDINLEFVHDQQKKSIDKLGIVEVKQSKRAYSPIISILHELKIKEGSISKYCLGVASIYKEVKKNNFKEKLHNINKII